MKKAPAYYNLQGLFLLTTAFTTLASLIKEQFVIEAASTKEWKVAFDQEGTVLKKIAD